METHTRIAAGQPQAQAVLQAQALLQAQLLPTLASSWRLQLLPAVLQADLLPADLLPAELLRQLLPAVLQEADLPVGPDLRSSLLQQLL